MQSFADIFKIPELRKRIFFTLGILIVYRIGVAIPIPGINGEAIQQIFKANSNSFLGFLDMFSGGAMSRMSIFAMGVMPYINSSIIMSLLQGAHVIPYLDRLAKEGESGRRRLNQITRYFTLFLAVIQSFGLTTLITKIRLGGDLAVVREPGALFVFTTVITLTAGTIFIMWLGEQITEMGVGNGISLMIFTGIVEGLPRAINQVRRMVFELQEMSLLTALGLLGLVIVVVGLVVWVATAQRKIPVQYARRMVGRKMYGGASTFLPLKVDQSGVIAVIFAVSLLSVPVTFASFNPEGEISKKILGLWNQRALWYEALYAGLIIFFCYFYNSVQFNPTDLADNLKKWGGFIPGIRPGEPTASYINSVLMRITLGGALFVASLAILPDIMHRVMNTPFYFGGTSILIVVGVALDTVGQLESHLIMRHYEGFSKTGRVKGRWFNVGAAS
ncbi:MAG: preprotein translocase subunit SecY [Elusimicrobia bacterium]|jgi:preprotein translocase subunit SecY|nr:preprotein translocase subunit SecY [Elusimicrobiota bacterium]